MQVALYRLRSSDWATYKAIRLEALLTERGVYCGIFAKEAGLADEQWQAHLAATDRAFWALYDGAACIGLTGIVTTSGETASLIASYIHPSYRGRGLSSMLYEARIRWAKELGVKTLTVSHRAGNEASRRANQRFGFVFTHSQPRTWPDGETVDELSYRLEL